ncbi:MAG: addiction module protein [Kiritimatiellae bacterium]|jgi:hypothetical protein|nr:addiction module protein [Kiritimatiellia bacterium]
MITAEIKEMPVKDRLILMEEIWDSLKNDNPESPAWHLDVLKERKKKIREGKAEFISIDQLKTSR